MPAASLGHYASLSFVVIGGRANWGLRDCGLMKGGRQEKTNFFLAPCALRLAPLAL